MNRIATTLSIRAFAILFLAMPTQGSDWPQWRGPGGTGYAPDGTPPTEWSATKNVRWKTEIPGQGYSSPIVSGDRIYLLTAVKTEKEIKPAAKKPEEDANAGEAQDGGQGGRGRRRGVQAPSFVHEYRVLALDRVSGEVIWNKKVNENVPHEGMHPTSTRASSSALTDGERIYASFGSNGLFCLDLDGNVIWDKQLGKMTSLRTFGEGASPVLEGNTLIVPWDHEGDSFVAAFDASSGEQIWRNPRDEQTTWSTPVITKVNGSHQVILAGEICISYDLASGEEIWRCQGLTDNTTPTPIIGHGMLYLPCGPLLAIKLADAKGDITDTDAVVWTHNKGTPSIPSPMLANKNLYFLGGMNGILSCFDAITGESHYLGQRLEEVRNVYSSLVGANGYIYICGREGNVAVVKDGPEFELVGINKLDGEGINATPAIVGDAIYIRTDSYLYCIGETE